MDFPKSKGGLWTHNKTSEKQPDMKGHVEISRDILRMLLNEAKAGVSEIKLQVAGWDRTAQSNGSRYMYLTAEAYVPKEFQSAVLAAGNSIEEPSPAPIPEPDNGTDPWD